MSGALVTVSLGRTLPLFWRILALNSQNFMGNKHKQAACKLRLFLRLRPQELFSVFELPS